MPAQFGVSFPQVWNELEKIWVLGCFTVTSGPHFLCKSCPRFCRAKLMNTITWCHLYARFFNNLMARTFIVEREQPIHFLYNRSHPEKLVIARMITWYFVLFIADAKVITNLWEPSQGKYFPKTSIVHVRVSRKCMAQLPRWIYWQNNRCTKVCPHLFFSNIV